MKTCVLLEVEAGASVGSDNIVMSGLQLSGN